MNIPGGRLAEMFGGKHLFGFGILFTAALTLLTPEISKLGPGAMIAVRILQGVGEVIIVNGLYIIYSQIDCW